MNRRDFFRRTVPAVALTVAATQSTRTLDFFKRLLGRVLRQCQEVPLENLIPLQASAAIKTLANAIDHYIFTHHRSFYDGESTCVPV